MTIRLLTGDCREVLATLPEASVHCVVTSPPYYALRSYLDASHPDKHRELGSEPTPSEYLAAMVEVFRAVRRVLRDDGTCWVNIGSSYSTGKGSNVTDQLNRLIEGGSVFFTDAGPGGVSGHGVGIALQNERAPDGELSGFLAAEGSGVEQRDEHLRKIADLFASPRSARPRPAVDVGLEVAEVADANILLDESEHRPVVMSELDAQPEAILAVLRPGGARPGENDKAALAVHQTDEPRICGHVRWHSAWHTFAREALRKGVEDVHLVDQAVALGDRSQTLVGLLRDFRITAASRKQVTLTSIHGGLSLAISDVRHLWFVLRCGSIVPYRKLIEDASRSANALLPKQDLGMPWRLVRALQEDGWILRSPIIWHKPNPMPESCTDRPTSAHEHVFLLSKRARYFYDADAVREEPTGRVEPMRFGREVPPGAEPHSEYHTDGAKGRNLRNVWTIPTHAYSDAHFATFPPALVERCIRAGTSERGCCAACGAPWVRITDTSYERNRHGHSGRTDASGSNGWDGGSYPNLRRVNTTTGWRAGCQCEAGVVPATVLDPFVGSGTTALVADRLQRHAIGIDLSIDYAAMAQRRLEADAPLFTSWAPAETDAQDERMRDLFSVAAD